MTTDEHCTLVEIFEGNPWDVRRRLRKFIDEAVITEEPKEKRSSPQNRALHLFCGQLAQALNDAGKDMRVVLKPDYFVPWTKESVKEHIWRPIMKAMTGKESTTELDKSEEISSIHKVIMREIGEKHGIENIPFPSRDTEALKKFAGYGEMDETNRADKF